MKTHCDKNFEVLGYFKEYSVDGIFYGSKECEKPDIMNFGSESRCCKVAEKDIKFKKRTIKKGQKYIETTNMLCGRSKIQFNVNRNNVKL